MVWQVVVWSYLPFPLTTFMRCRSSLFTITFAKMWLELGTSCIFNLFSVSWPISLFHTLICLSSLCKTDSPCEPVPYLHPGSSAVLWQITGVLIEWSNWIMVPGNEFSTFGLRHPSQTDSYYLLRDPEARVANYTPHNSPNQWKKEKETTAGHFTARLRGQAPSVCTCVTERGRARQRVWNETILPFCQIWLEHSCHFTPPSLYYLEGLGKAI